MISKNIEKAINEQINAEMHSSYLYLSMAAYFASKGLEGFESWMKLQAREENMHAMKFFDYINERGGRVRLSAIEAPAAEWESPLAAFQAASKHEKYITGRIDSLMSLAIDEKDFASQNLLQWY